MSNQYKLLGAVFLLCALAFVTSGKLLADIKSPISNQSSNFYWVDTVFFTIGDPKPEYIGLEENLCDGYVYKFLSDSFQERFSADKKIVILGCGSPEGKNSNQIPLNALRVQLDFEVFTAERFSQKINHDLMILSLSYSRADNAQRSKPVGYIQSVIPITRDRTTLQKDFYKELNGLLRNVVLSINNGRENWVNPEEPLLLSTSEGQEEFHKNLVINMLDERNISEEQAIILFEDYKSKYKKLKKDMPSELETAFEEFFKYREKNE